jgi:hypothetical protein
MGTHFALPSTSPPSRESRRPGPPPFPSDIAVPLASAFSRWVSDFTLRASSDPRCSPLLALTSPSATPSWWSRRLPPFYSHFPSIASRALVAASRAHLPVRGLPLLGGDGRALDPDPPHIAPPPPASISVCLTSPHPHYISLRSSLPAPLHLPSLLASPPPSWSTYLHLISRYRRYVSSGVSLQSLHRLLPELGPLPPG